MICSNFNAQFIQKYCTGEWSIGSFTLTVKESICISSPRVCSLLIHSYDIPAGEERRTHDSIICGEMITIIYPHMMQALLVMCYHTLVIWAISECARCTILSSPPYVIMYTYAQHTLPTTVRGKWGKNNMWALRRSRGKDIKYTFTQWPFGYECGIISVHSPCSNILMSTFDACRFRLNLAQEY